MKQGVEFDTDEELIAYASGDLQGSFESSWIWQESKGHVLIGKPLQSFVNVGPPDSHQRELEKATSFDGAAEWSGWDRIVRTIEGLANDRWQAKEPKIVWRTAATAGDDTQSFYKHAQRPNEYQGSIMT